MMEITNIKILTLLFIFSIIPGVSNSNTPTQIDSLKKILAKHNITQRHKCRIYYQLAYKYSSTSHLDSAEYFFKQANKQGCKANGVYKGYEVAYKGLAEMRSSNYKEALVLLKAAAAIFNKYDYKNEYYSSLANIGILLSNLDSNYQAIETTKKTINFFKNNKRYLSIIYNNIGKYYLDINILDSAAYYLYEAYLLKEKSGNYYDLDIVTLDLSSVYLNMENYNKAKHFLDLSLKYCKKAKDTIGLGYVYNNFGSYYSSLNKIDSALYFYNLSSQIFKYTNDYYHYIISLSNSASLYINNKNYKKSLDIYNTILKYAKREGYRNLISFAYLSLSNLYYVIKSYKTAVAYSDSAFLTAKQLSDYNQIYNSLEIKAQSLYLLKSYKEAFETEKLVAQYRDSMLNEQKLKAVKEAEVKFQTEKFKLENQLKAKTIKLQNLQIKRKNQTILLLSVFAFLVLLLALLTVFLIKNRYKQRLYRYQLQAQEKTKNKIATALHNDIGGSLAAVILRLKENNAHNTLDKEINMLQSIYETIRTQSHILAVPNFIHTALDDKLQDLVATYQTQKLKIYLDIFSKKGWKDVHPFIQENIYRIVQELVNNSLKHSQATEIDIQIIRNKNQVTIMYEDNGIGYNPEQIKYGKGFRDEIIDRVKALNAKLYDETKQDQGVNIIIKLKIK